MKKETTANLKHAYEKWHVDRSLEEDSERTLNSPWNTFVRNRIGSVQGKTILEMACGRGQFSAYLASQGAQMVSSDFSFRALEVLKKSKSSAGICAANADASKIPAKDECFDIVVSCETIEHLMSPEAALREFRRVLKKDGKLFLSFPSHLNLYSLYRIYLKLRGRPYNSGDQVQPRENWLFSFQVVSLLKKIGYRVTYTGGLGHYLLLPGRHPKNLTSLDETRWVNRFLKPFALHAFVIAEPVK